jgi:hypothetical protein
VANKMDTYEFKNHETRNGSLGKGDMNVAAHGCGKQAGRPTCYQNLSFSSSWLGKPGLAHFDVLCYGWLPNYLRRNCGWKTWRRTRRPPSIDKTGLDPSPRFRLEKFQPERIPFWHEPDSNPE